MRRTHVEEVFWYNMPYANELGNQKRGMEASLEARLVLETSCCVHTPLCLRTGRLFCRGRFYVLFFYS